MSDTSDAEPNGDKTAYTYNDLNQATDEIITNTNTAEPVFKEQTAWQNDGQKQDVADTRYNVDGSVFSQITYTWAYDADNRIENETLTVQSGSGTSVPTPYSDAYDYDLDNNRMHEFINGGVFQSNGSNIVYTYNGDDQLITEIGSGTIGAYETDSAYDSNGNLISQTRTGDGAESDTYGYDLQNRMISADVGGTNTTYTYDYNGVLTSETTGSQTVYDLNDPNNPTGYSKAIQQSTSLAGSPTISYVAGLTVIAQSSTASGTQYLLTDTHGSTRAMSDTSGAVISGQTFDYDAYGDVLTNASTAATMWLFGGDGAYDQATGFTYQLARWRNGDSFTASDTYQNSSDDPLGLNEYNYADANPIDGTDPTGHFIDTLVSTSQNLGDEAAEAETANLAENSATASIESGVDLLEGVEAGFNNAAFASNDTEATDQFAVGFAGGSIGEAAYFWNRESNRGPGRAKRGAQRAPNKGPPQRADASVDG